MAMTRAEQLAHRKRVAEGLVEGGEQLDMWGESGSVVPAAQRSGPGRPAGSPNKLTAKLGQLMAQRGYRDPAEHLAMMAGLDRPDVHPIAYAAQIAAELGEDVMDVAKVMRQAAADVLPYYHAKLTPDVQVNLPVMQVTMAAPMAGQATDGRRVGPPPMPGQAEPAPDADSEQDQSLSGEGNEP